MTDGTNSNHHHLRSSPPPPPPPPPSPHDFTGPSSSPNIHVDPNPRPTRCLSLAASQFRVDVKLDAVFEQYGESDRTFDYMDIIRASGDAIPDQEVKAYLRKMQHGGLLQPFGCMLVVSGHECGVVAYSENAREMLGIMIHTAPDSGGPEILTFGTDARTLFTPDSASLLQRALTAQDISLNNPILLVSRFSGKPFYAIIHSIDMGTVIDLEPAEADIQALLAAGAVQSQKLAMRAISRLQALPGGNIQLLCDTAVSCIRDLCGYDRVMVYKFHADRHGEVVAESRRADLEPYLGLHYPATDIPQVARFLFKQNRVRIIADCHASPVRVLQDSLEQPMCLIQSTLRAPHACHTQYMANMGSVASLVLAVLINGVDDFSGLGGHHWGNHETRLWGLIIGHHVSHRYLNFPIRLACEFIMQAFGLQLNVELRLAQQLIEKRFLKTQTLLCDMLKRDSPTAIVTKRPSIMDLVRCDGAGLYHHGRFYPLGVAPTEAQIEDIMRWMLARQQRSTGLSTVSLADADYPRAEALGDAVCGMVAARITERDCMFWFRSHSAKEVTWGGPKHEPGDEDDGDEGTRMVPRLLFKGFFEVVKRRSLAWEGAELDAIHSLQLMLRVLFQAAATARESMAVVPAAAAAELEGVSPLTRDIVRLLETATAPIFLVGSDGRMGGWNGKLAQLTGFPTEVMLGKSLVEDVVHEESREAARDLFARAMRGEEDKDVELRLNSVGEPVYVMVNARCNKNDSGNVVGMSCIGQDITSQRLMNDKFVQVQTDHRSIIQSPTTLIPPIFASDEHASCSEWNATMEDLTGWARPEVVGKLLIGQVFGSCCKLKGPDAMTRLMIVLHNAIEGQDTENFPLVFSDRRGNYIQALLTASKRVNTGGQIVGAFFFLQGAGPRDGAWGGQPEAAARGGG